MQIARLTRDKNHVRNVIRRRVACLSQTPWNLHRGSDFNRFVMRSPSAMLSGFRKQPRNEIVLMRLAEVTDRTASVKY